MLDKNFLYDIFVAEENQRDYPRVNNNLELWKLTLKYKN